MLRTTVNSRTARKWLLYVPHTCPLVPYALCVPCPVYLVSHVLRSHMSYVSDSLHMFFGPICLMCPIPCTCPSVPYVLGVRFPVCLLHMSFCPICLVTINENADRMNLAKANFSEVDPSYVLLLALSRTLQISVG